MATPKIMDTDEFLQQCYLTTGGYRLVWPLGTGLELGDYGPLAGFSLAPLGNIGQPLNTPLPHYSSSKEGVPLERTLTISDSEGNIMQILLEGLEHQRIDDLENLQSKLLERFGRDEWQADWVLVHERLMVESVSIRLPLTGPLAEWIQEDDHWAGQVTWDSGSTPPGLRSGAFRQRHMALFYRCLGLREFDAAQLERTDIGFEFETPEGFVLQVIEPF